MEQFLTETQRLLEEGNTGNASDLLFEYLLTAYGKPTAIDLPANVCSLPPKIVISHLRRALGKLRAASPVNNNLCDRKECYPEDVDLDLILETSAECEARQELYVPNEETQEILPLANTPEAIREITPPQPLQKIDGQKHNSEAVNPELTLIVTQSPITPSTDEAPPEELCNHYLDLPEINLDMHADDFEDVFLIDELGEIDSEPSTHQETSSEEKDYSEWLLDDDYFSDDDEGDEREELYEVEYVKLSRKERAWQIAYELASSFGWDDQGIALLQEIFLERGWQQAKVAMEYLLHEGITQDQLKLAKELKKYWELHSELTIVFYRTRKDRSDYSYSGEQILSWRVAVDIVGRFQGCTDFDEINLFVEEALDTWYSNSRLRHDYRSFQQYLRTVARHRECLSANLLDIEPIEEQYSDSNDYAFRSLINRLYDDY